MRITTFITLSLVVPLFIAYVVIDITTIVPVWKNSKIWLGEIQDVVKANEFDSLQKRTADRTALSDLIFEQIIDHMNMLGTYATDLYNDRYNLTGHYISYYGVSTLGDERPPGTSLNEMNPKYNAWFMKTLDDLSDVTGALEARVNKASIMNNGLRTIHQSNPEAYISVYMGFEEDGRHHILPWMSLDGYYELEIHCERTDEPTVGYDPRCRVWYDMARNNGDTHDVIFTPPYNDATTGELLITSAKPIYDKNDELVGVVAIDISLQFLEKQLLTSTILESGYTFLLDDEGNAVIYPDLSRDDIMHVTDLEFDSEEEREQFMNVYDTMMDGGKGIHNYTKFNADSETHEVWYISFRKVPSAPYTLAMVVPENEINASSDLLRKRIINGMIGAISGFVVVAIVAMIVVIGVNYKMTQRFLEPIHQLNNFMNELNNHNLEAEMGDAPRVSKEITKITDSFKRILMAVRFGNEEYYKGKLDVALTNYEDVLKLMREMKNPRGEGVCLNNIALVKDKMDDHNGAKKYYDMAVQNAIQMKETAKVNKSSEEIGATQIILANRYMNFGLHYLNRNKMEKAYEYLMKSYELHSGVDNLEGIAKVVGNLAYYYYCQDDLDSAYERLDEAFEMIMNRNNDVAKQHIAMNLGIYYHLNQDHTEANKWFSWVLENFSTLTRDVRKNTLLHMTEGYKKLGEIDKMEAALMDSGLQRHVTFVIDVSGSMGGSRIRTCRDSITDIIGQYITGTDLISLIKFSAKSDFVFRNVRMVSHPKRKHRLGLTDKRITECKSDEVIDCVQNKTVVSGGTAFWDALKMAITTCESTGDNWVIALTDGEDNKSRSNYHDIIKLLKTNTNTTIIAITVGPLKNINQVQAVCAASMGGQHIPAGTDINSIADAFKQAGSMMGIVNLETF